MALLHVPLAAAPAAVLQARQSTAPAPHALLQHTLSTQKPLWHWLLLEQADPFTSGVAHTLAVQIPLAQSLFIVQPTPSLSLHTPDPSQAPFFFVKVMLS
jgi:hypothetical protein